MSIRVAPKDIELHLVDSAERAEAFLAWEPVSHYVSVDVETTGLQPFGARGDRIRMVQFGDENTGWAIPYETGSHLVDYGLDRWAGRFTNHNSPFDTAFLLAAGHTVTDDWEDTLIAHHLLFPLDYHGLKPAAAQLYGREVRAGEKWLDQVKRQTKTDWATVDIYHPAYWGYAALDTVLAVRLGTDIVAKAKERFPEQYARELEVSRMVKDIQRRGLRVDVAYAEQLRDKWAVEEAEIREKLGRYMILKPGSAKQIIAALENDGWEPDVFTDSGKPSVNRAVLEGMDHEVAELVLRWRRITKWSKAYAIPLIESDGRLHPIINSIQAKTGRMSIEGGLYSAPLQQWPKGPEVRSALLAEEGMDLWATDYTGQEMRLLAAFASDDGFTHSVLNGEDVHGRIALELFGAEYSREQRGWTKNGLYAYAYGAQDKRLGLTIHASANKFKKAVGLAYPGILHMMEAVMRVAGERQERDGMAWAKTLGGRIVAVPKSKHYALTNYIMQGSGADMMKMAMIRMKEAGVSDRIALLIHDEALSNLPPGPEGEEIAHTIAECMTTEFRGVPFAADPLGPAESWGGLVH